MFIQDHLPLIVHGQEKASIAFEGCPEGDLYGQAFTGVLLFIEDKMSLSYGEEFLHKLHLSREQLDGLRFSMAGVAELLKKKYDVRASEAFRIYVSCLKDIERRSASEGS